MSATQAVIHLGNLRKNVRSIKAHAGEETMICCAVKANAYGHGAVEVSRVLIEEGVSHLATATVDEATLLRKSGIKAPILLFSPFIPEDRQKVIDYSLTPLVFSRKTCRELEDSLKRRVKPNPGDKMDVHLHIDTGMGRLGCSPDEAPLLAEYIGGSDFLRLGGTCTHFPSADMTDDAFTRDQVALMHQIIMKIKKKGIDPGIVHMANSGGIAGYPASFGKMIRPGILLYGYYPSREQERIIPVEPVMEVVSRLVHIKKVPKGTPISYGRTYHTPHETHIGTVAAGYADGYPRLLSNKASVSIRKKVYPVVGTICMDLFMVDLGKTIETEVYDEVILFGPHRGKDTGTEPGGNRTPNAEDLARITGTIPYEITCGITGRVKRLYLDG